MKGTMKGTRKHLAVLALADGDEVLAAVRKALDTAPEAERPGLTRAVAVIREAAAGSEDELKGRWVRQKLEAAGYEGPPDSVTAIKTLRSAEPALSLIQAVDLARAAARAQV